MLAVSSEGPSTLGAHLAEMDRLLRDIQAELLPDREPAPPLADPATSAASSTPPEGLAGSVATPVAAPGPASDEQIAALTELATRLVASMRELLAGYERVVAQASPTPPAGPPRAAPAPPPAVALAAGPFPSLEALREFEHAITHLPGVREVAVQAYEGTDRAVIEVRLDHPSP
jgi:hypothetical protein